MSKEMQKIENPFEMLANQLIRIESMLFEMQKQHTGTKPKTNERTDYLSVSEAAVFLGVSNGSIYRYVMTGVLQKKKFGNKLYFSKSALINLIEKGINQ